MPRAVGAPRRRIVVICGLAAAVVATTLAVVSPVGAVRRGLPGVRRVRPFRGAGLRHERDRHRRHRRAQRVEDRTVAVAARRDRAAHRPCARARRDRGGPRHPHGGTRPVRAIDRTATNVRRDEDRMPAAGLRTALADASGGAHRARLRHDLRARCAPSGACLSHPLPLVARRARASARTLRSSGRPAPSAICRSSNERRPGRVPECRAGRRRHPPPRPAGDGYDGRVYRRSASRL